MKVTVKGDLLTKTLRRSILTNTPINATHALVKIEARKKQGDEPATLVFTSTAGTLSLNTIIGADVAEGGVIAANAKALFTAAGAMPPGDILLTADDKRVRLKGGAARNWSTATADAGAIQPTPEPKGAAWLKIPVEMLRTAIERVGYATQEVEKYQESKAGIRIEGAPDKLTAVACGPYMFACFEQEAKGLGMKDAKWQGLLPTQVLPGVADVIAEALEMKSEYVELYIDQSQVYVIGPATLLVASLPIGDYPPWESIFKNFPTEPVCVVPRLALMESIRACEATGSRLSDGAMFRLRKMALEISRDDESEFGDTVPVTDMQPNTDLIFKIGTRYLHAMLKGADADAGLHFDAGGALMLLKADGYRAASSLMRPKPEEGPPPAADDGEKKR